MYSLLIVLTMFLMTTNALYCPYKPYECQKPEFQETHCAHAPKTCPGAILKDLCGCCNMCAKMIGEKCGGPFHAFGHCDETLNLQCVKNSTEKHAAGTCQCKEVPHPYDCLLEKTAAGCNTGRCKPLPVCEEIQYKRRSKSWWGHRCYKKDTVFCDRYCGECCQHSSTCKPNPYQWKKRSQCNIGFLGDESEVDMINDDI